MKHQSPYLRVSWAYVRPNRTSLRPQNRAIANAGLLHRDGRKVGARRTNCRNTPLTGCFRRGLSLHATRRAAPRQRLHAPTGRHEEDCDGRHRGEERHHRGTAAGARRGLRARQEGARDHRDLRPGARRPPVPGGGVGGREQADVHAPRRHGHQGERPRRRGEPDGQADEDPRRAARRAAPEERRHHRGAAGEGHRQVRQAGGDHRLHRADDQSGPDARRQRDLRRSRRATSSSSRRTRARRRRRSRPCA